MHDSLPILPWAKAMALFSSEDADMVRRKAQERHSDILLIQGPRGVRAVLISVPRDGKIIGITKLIQQGENS